jgi:hypothetical protein
MFAHSELDIDRMPVLCHCYDGISAEPRLSNVAADPPTYRPAPWVRPAVAQICRMDCA